jgi:hypothetical protein
MEDRFIEYARTIDGSELIDELDFTEVQRKAQKADFFFDNRSIICELKSLKTDTEPKIEKILEPFRKTDDWPMFYGTWEVSKILEHLPNKEEINEKIIDVISSSIQGQIRSANRQIRSTKEVFGIPDSGGILVILNDAVDVLTPEIIIHRIRQTLNKKTPDGELQFPYVDCVCTFHDAHYFDLTPALRTTPGFILLPDHSSSKIERFAEGLHRGWAAYEGLPYIEAPADALKDLTSKLWSDILRDDPREMARSDQWRKNYRKHPVLRTLPDEDLIRRGQQILRTMAPMMIKDGPWIPEHRLRQMAIPFTHFLEEINHRGIDMKSVTPPDGWRAPRELETFYQKPEPGPPKSGFYLDPTTGGSYFCRTTIRKKTTWELVEAYHPDTGDLLQFKFTKPRDWLGEEMLRVVGRDEIERLTEIYKRILKKRNRSRRRGRRS